MQAPRRGTPPPAMRTEKAEYSSTFSKGSSMPSITTTGTHL